MAEAIAEKKSEEKKKDQEKSTEELAKDIAATELLKEIDEAVKADADSKEEADKDDGDGQSKDGETPDTDDSTDDADSQPDGDKQKGKRGFKKRQSRLVKQREEAKAATDAVSVKLATSEEEKKLLQMKIDQLEGRQILKEPNPDDFDGGDMDPGFVKANKDFNDARIERMVNDKVQAAHKLGGQAANKEQHAQALEDKQKKHWEEADALGAKDYDDKEENLIKSIGAEMVTNIIDYFPGESSQLVYYLGTNSKEAEAVGELLEDRATLVKGVAQLGRILERIKVKNPNTSIAPDPDKETEGSSPSPQESLQNRLETLRVEATKDGNKNGMKRILEFKRKAKERGITLR